MLEDKLTVETPEQVQLDFPLAGIGSRFLALAVDTIFQVVIGLALVVAALVSRVWPNSAVWMLALLILAIFLVQFGYFAFFESVWNGQTPGKRRLYLRVIKDSGQPITTYDAVARNLMRIVDSVPGIYGIAIVSVLLSPRNKRLGDYVAGTVVVHEQPLEQQAGIGANYTAQPQASGYDLAQVQPEEFELVETFLLRRGQLAPEVRSALARQIIGRLGPKLKLLPADLQHPEVFLERLAAEYRSRGK